VRSIVFIYLLIASYSIGIGQKVLKQLTTDEGLSEIQCFDIFQDSKGYIWIGTSAGANKYDGRDVKSFDRSNGLLSDHIYSFHEDSQNRIWINNLNGEPLFIKDDKVHNRLTNPYLEKMNRSHHWVGWCEDINDKIWFGHAEGGVTILDQDSVFYHVFQESVDSSFYVFYGLLPYKDEIILISSLDIKSIDAKTLETNWTFPIRDSKAYLRKLIHNDKIYLFSLFEAYVFDLVSKEFKTIKRADGNPPIYDCRILYDQVFISTAEGISIFNDSIIVNYDLHSSIDSISVSALHQDVDDNLWIATLENGAFLYYNSDVEHSKYSDYCNVIYIEEYSNDSVFIIQDDWNISLIENDTRKLKKSLNKRGENRFNNVFYKDGELWIVDKYRLHIDVEGEYETFGMYNRKVYYDEETGAFYWIGTKGFSYIDDINLLFKYEDMHDLINKKVEKVTLFSMDKPYDFEVVSKSEFWVGGEEGLFHIHNDKMNRMDNPEFDGSITDLVLMDNHLIGVNYGNGLFDYNLESGKVELISRQDGLPTNHIAHLDVDGNDIWISHAKGICLLKKNENGLELIKIFIREHGIPKGKITLLKIIDNICHFVVNGHIYSIKPSQILNDTLEIIIDTSKLVYYTDESQTVNFDCINFAFGEKIQYQYRLLPLDSNWKETNGEKIDFEFVPAGEYELEVRAQHPFNLASPIKRKPIIIENRWYNENSFRFTLILLFGLLLYFLIRIKAISFNTANFKHWVGAKIQKYFVKEQRNSFNIKDINGVVHLLKINEIKFIKSSGNYLEYHTDSKKYVCRMTMSNAVKKFKLWTDIQRVHRSYMVNFKMIEAIDHKFLKIGSIDIPFTERYRGAIEEKLQL